MNADEERGFATGEIERVADIVQHEANHGADSPVDRGDAEQIAKAVIATLMPQPAMVEQRYGHFEIADDPDGFVGVKVVLGGNAYLTQRKPETGTESMIVLSREQADRLGAILRLAPADEVQG